MALEAGPWRRGKRGALGCVAVCGDREGGKTERVATESVLRVIERSTLCGVTAVCTRACQRWLVRTAGPAQRRCGACAVAAGNTPRRAPLKQQQRSAAESAAAGLSLALLAAQGGLPVTPHAPRSRRPLFPWATTDTDAQSRIHELNRCCAVLWCVCSSVVCRSSSENSENRTLGRSHGGTTQEEAGTMSVFDYTPSPQVCTVHSKGSL